MKIGKIHLAFPDQIKLKWLGFFYTNDYLGPFKNICGRSNDLGPGFFIIGIAESAGLTGIFLDQNPVSKLPHEFNSPRAHTHTIFFSLDFF